MGLTLSSTGKAAASGELQLVKERPDDWVVALAGNPNVGKSTVFNALTGMNQHTGNWPGKTVGSAQGQCKCAGHGCVLVDLPGTYSLMAHSAEEEVARDFICFGGSDAAIVVCDATCLERNLNLVYQTIEISPRVVVCVNLLDEARKKRIHVDLKALSSCLGVPVVGASARAGKGLEELTGQVARLASGESRPQPPGPHYTPAIERALETVVPVLARKLPDCPLGLRWLGLRLLEDDRALLQAASEHLSFDLLGDQEICQAADRARQVLQDEGTGLQKLRDNIVSCLVLSAEDAASQAVTYETTDHNLRDRRLDRLLTSRRTGIPVMLALLALVFWLTIAGANVPSQLLADGLFWVQGKLTELFAALHAPAWLHGVLVLGMFRVLAWVISVMLPPMAIFFPLFTLLEDFGYLPRVAFNLDRCFQKACACGKQALTMAMGFGCNAAGIVGCRIIDSPRERLIAILTNNFVPCNGRFPTLISLLTMFFIGASGGLGASISSALLLTAIILFGVFMTFWMSRLLSKTVLKGVPSSFTLELPPYRRPQIGKVIVRSIFDRTLFVLGRAVAVAAPAGVLIWLLANITVGDMSLLSHCAAFLDPLGKLLGMDGVILMAFILGFPANEIVVPIIIMAYLATGSLTEMASLTELHALLLQNGWTWVTAVCVMLFSLMHWPCSTTLITIHKETGSAKWTALAFLLPTAAGMLACFLFSGAMGLLGIG